jgi:hypothetical protein
VIGATLAYVLAFALALAAAWGVESLSAGAIFRDPAPAHLLASLIFPPLAGLAVFAPVFGLKLQHPMGLRFWLVSLPLTFLPVAFGFGLIHGGYATPAEALVIAVGLIFLAGWIATRRLLGRG